MENKEKVANLHNLYSDVSKKLSSELLKNLPDISTLKDFRKQLGQLDRDISRIQMRRDWN